MSEAVTAVGRPQAERSSPKPLRPAIVLVLLCCGPFVADGTDDQVADYPRGPAQTGRLVLGGPHGGGRGTVGVAAVVRAPLGADGGAAVALLWHPKVSG